MDKIPLDRPVLIASNHPSAFLEACLLATHFPKSLHFLVRGDIFINKFIIKLLAQLHLTPIYRSTDGFKNLRANETTFNTCHSLLKQNNIIVVYAEGNTTQEKRLRPIQKGLARIAFGALDKHPDMNLCIVPLGVNYTSPNEFRSEVMVEVGEPIELDSYYTTYHSDSIKAITELTKTVEEAMKPLVIHINRDEDLPLAERLFELNKARLLPDFWPVIDRTGERFKLDKKTADEINHATPEDLKKSMDALPLKTFRRAYLSPLAWIGLLFNWAPLQLGYLITKSKVTRIEFFASVLVGTTMFLYIFYVLIIAIISQWSGLPIWLILGIIFTSGLVYLWEKHRNQIRMLKSLRP